MFKLFAYFMCIQLTVISGQTMVSLPPLETLPPDSMMNTSSIVSPYDESCMNADNSTDQDNVVYLGAVALNNDNECEVICQKQVLQQFQIMFWGLVKTRAVIIGNIFSASMPDNSTCAQTGTCFNGTCSVNTTNSTSNSTAIPENTTMSSNMTQSTTMSTTMSPNMTQTITMSTNNMTDTTTMMSNSTQMMTNSTQMTTSARVSPTSV